MTGVFPSPETVKRFRANYPQGCRVELVSMTDPFTNLKAGDKGTVEFVDDIGTVFVSWDNGSSLGAAYGSDTVKRI